MLAKLESMIFFLAMMLAIVLAGGMVYWIFEHPVAPAISFSLTGHWTGAALPQAWLFGALCMLAFRWMGIFMAASTHAAERGGIRKDFFRLWCWTIGLVALEGFAFFLDRVAGA